MRKIQGKASSGLVVVLALAAGAPARAAEPQTFTPPGPPAARYGAGEVKCASSALSRELGDQVGLEAARRKTAVAVQDPALCAVAEDFLDWNEKEQGGRPRKTLVSLASQHAGRVTAARDVLLAQFETEVPTEIAERLLEPIAAMAARTPTPRWGLAQQRVKKGLVKVVLVLGDAPVQVEPLPRRLEPGQSAPLVGALADKGLQALVLVSDARGALTTVTGEGPAFKAEVKCAAPGVTLVEVRSKKGDEVTTLASFPVGCGVDLPASAALKAPEWPAAVADQERRALEVVNAERAGVGLKPLAWNQEVAGVARQVAEALRAGQSGDADVVARLKQAGIVSLAVMQSAAADRTVGGANERLLASPSNRANLLSSEVNLAGVGVVAGTDPDGDPIAYLVELMVKELQPIDVVKGREELRQALLAKRRGAKASEAVSNPVLDEVAQKFAAADAAAGGALTRKQQSDILAPVNAGFQKVTFLYGAKADLLAILDDPDALGDGRLIGVGLAQGTSPTLGKNSLFPCILLGVSRGDAAAPAKPAAKPVAQPAAKPGKPGKPGKP